MSATKAFLVVNRHSPYGSHFFKEALDAALTAAVFNQRTSILFIDDGVLQLLAGQAPQHINAKNNTATLPMLEMYDINAIYVDHASLSQRGFREQDLLITCQCLRANEITELLAQQDVILNF